MFSSRDPKTTIPGILLILIGLISLIFGVGPTAIIEAVSNFQLGPIITQLFSILTGIGLLGAGDNNKS